MHIQDEFNKIKKQGSDEKNWVNNFWLPLKKNGDFDMDEILDFRNGYAKSS